MSDLDLDFLGDLLDEGFDDDDTWATVATPGDYDSDENLSGDELEYESWQEIDHDGIDLLDDFDCEEITYREESVFDRGAFGGRMRQWE